MKREGLIAEAMVQRLLWETEASEAVATLAQFWSGRLQSNLPQWGLSMPEYRVQLILIYMGEVGNGGHGQFFLNRGQNTAMATIGALKVVGLDGLADSLAAALAVLNASELAALSAVDRARLDICDQRAYETFLAADDLILKLMRSEAGQILRPERGL